MDKSFPVGEETTFEAIARSVGLDVKNVRRFLRHAMTDYLFCEPRKEVVAHTGLTKLLREDGLLHDCVANALEELWPAAARVCSVIPISFTRNISADIMP